MVLTLAVDWAYVEAAWNAAPGTDPDLGVPTSYYTAVQLLCRAEVVAGARRSMRPGAATVRVPG